MISWIRFVVRIVGNWSWMPSMIFVCGLGRKVGCVYLFLRETETALVGLTLISGSGI